MSYWTKCWKCENAIKSEKDCFYIKCSDGKYDYCPTCYKEFIDKTTEFIRPERSRKQEIYRSFNIAIEEFHNQMEQYKAPIRKGHRGAPTTLIHKGSYGINCDVCEEMMKVPCLQNCNKEK